MQLDRFKNFDKDTREAVLNYEKLRRKGGMQYVDMDQLEIVLDFYLETNDVDSVQSALKYGEQLFPNANELKLRRAHMYSIQNNPQAALALLKEILRSEPGNTDAQYAMGLVYGMLDQPQKALQYYQMASADGVELGLIYGNMADEYYKMDRFDKAVLYYKKSIAENPDEERSMYNLLCIYEDEGLHQEAEAYFREQTQAHPYSFSAWIAYGRACMNLDMWQQAIDAYEYAVVIDKTSVQAYFCLADAYRQAGDPGKAVSVLHECLDYSDDKSWIYYSMGMIYLESGNATSATVYFRKTVQEDPYFGDAWQVLGQCYADQNDFYTAIEVSERALSINPQSSAYMLQLAMFQEQVGDFDKAETLYQCAITLDEVSDECWLRYADYLIRHEAYMEAVTVLEKGVIEALDQLEFNLRLAVCYFKTGRRGLLLNAIRACTADPQFHANELLSLCPEMSNDYEIISTIESR